jgi:ATP-dependent helicase/nuclease subunit B
VSLPERASRLAAPVERVDAEAKTDATRLRFLQAPADAGPAHRDGTIEIFHAGGRDAEIDEVFRHVFASGLPLDQVEIACASEAHALLAWEQASRLAWPVTLSSGVPAAVTRPGRLLLRFCEWLGRDLAAADLRRLLQSGDCAPAAFDASPGDEDAQITAGQAARLLLKAQATWGRSTYALALARLSEEYARRSKDEEASDEERQWSRRKAAQTRTFGAWVKEVLDTIPAPDTAEQVSLEAIVDAAVTFLEANASRASALDAMALVALTDALGELKALGAYRCDMGTGLEFLSGCLDSLHVGRDRPRPGHLHVSTLAEAAFDGRPRVFIVGLQEGGVFPAAVEDPVLLDEERARLSPLLRTSTDRLDEAVFGVLSRLAAIGTSSSAVCLSFSCRDTREFRETFPSWILLQAYRLRQGNAVLTYEHLTTSLGEPASAVPPDPDLAVTDAGWWLATCTSNASARPGILRTFPSLALGVRAEAARDSDQFTEFDGHVAVAGPVLDPSRTGRMVSATTLEDAAKCPFRFFLRQGLGVRPIEEAAADADAWLTPLTKGSELHDLFARVLRVAREQSRPPDLKKDLPRLRAWGDARLTELRAEMPPPSDEVYARERREFLDDLDAFLTAECEGRHGRDPVGVEVSFGFPLGDDQEPLDGAEPLVLDLGGKRRLRLHGRIDRINRLAPGKYEVIDYKTGGYWAPNWEGVFAGGTRLQHAVYGRAAEGLLAAHGKQAHVVRGVYVFPAVKGHRRQKAIDAPATATLHTVLRQLMDVIGTGAFAISEGKQGCRFCEFAHACHADDPAAPAGEDEETRATKKVANTADPVLDVFRELRSHE